MPTLDWIGKKAVVNHHKEVPFRLLKCDPDLSVGDPESGNLLVQGDNLLALKALLPYYAGQVKCIYIDPPYNTGNEGWVYNDNVNSAEMREWLGLAVGKEAEDLSRHDKWLCMMYPRIKILWQLLANDGVIFISINDVECSRLELLCNEIFGAKNFLARLIWNTEGNTDNQLEIKVNHEYILAYVRDYQYKSQAIGSVVDPNTRPDSNLWKGIADNNINKNNPTNPPQIIELPAGFPCAEKEMVYRRNKKIDEDFFETTKSEGMISKLVKREYGIEHLSGLPVKLDDMVVIDHKLQSACRIYGGFANSEKLKQFIDNGLSPVSDGESSLLFYLNKNAAVRYRREGHKSRNILSVLRNLGTTERTRTMLQEIGVDFNYPKPVDLIKYLVSFGCANKDGIVLDSFAGSGTTAHAVMELNKEDSGARKFIMVEMEKNICDRATSKRIAHFANELSVGFSYCNLSHELFDNTGTINGNVKFVNLARFVYLKETGLPLLEDVSGKSPLVGTYNGTAIYLLYNGIFGDKTPQGGNALTRSVLAVLPPHDGPKIIYGTSCRVGMVKLKQGNMIFRQIPYELRVS